MIIHKNQTYVTYLRSIVIVINIYKQGIGNIGQKSLNLNNLTKLLKTRNQKETKKSRSYLFFRPKFKSPVGLRNRIIFLRLNVEQHTRNSNYAIHDAIYKVREYGP